MKNILLITKNKNNNNNRSKSSIKTFNTDLKSTMIFLWAEIQVKNIILKVTCIGKGCY